ncbi:MAG: hypothetical protein Q8L29_04110 [archaeon]|nr:hypothetical protein [archaeon]
MKSDDVNKYFIGAIAGIGFTTLISFIFHDKIIPSVKEVQEGYIAPSRLRIDCEDLDKNGKLETFIYIDKTPYLFREVNGKPTLSPYEIIPVEESRVRKSPLVEKSLPEIK